MAERSLVSGRGGRGSGLGSFGRAGANGDQTMRDGDRLAIGVQPRRDGWNVGNGERGRLSGKSTERALIVTVASGGERRPLVVDVHAQGRGVAECRLEFGRDRHGVEARPFRRGQNPMIGHGGKLNDERQGDDERRQPRAERASGGPRPLSWTSRSPAAAAHLPCP
jgi:hypothetical protein